MLEPDTFSPSTVDGRAKQFEVRSVTGACYTLIEATVSDGGVDRHCYRTAYAGLPVIANEDGSFTLVDTHTRLLRVDSP
jgi:hypothetical protein